MNMMIPTIETNRMLLRALNIDDVDKLHGIFSNPLAMRYWDTSPHKSLKTTTDALEKLNESYQNEQGISWGIISKETNELIGYFGLHSWNISNDQTKLGYIINPRYWGKGLGNEVLNSIIDYCFNGTGFNGTGFNETGFNETGFNETGFKSIIAEVDPNNQSSIVILEKNSFILIEEKKNDFKINNNYYDTKVYERTKNTS